MEQCYDCIEYNSIFKNNNGRIVKMKITLEVKNIIIKYIIKNQKNI